MVMAVYNQTQLTAEINALQSLWQKRNAVMAEEYKVIRLDSDLKRNRTTDEEVVVSADPRTTFNMANFLLTPEVWSLENQFGDLTPDERSAMTYLQGYARARLNAAMIRSRRRVFGDIFSHVTRLLTATGWYAVSAMSTDKGWHISVWNPATVFPEYSDSGELLKVARIYTLSRQAAYKKIFEQGWLPIKITQGAVKIKQLWFWNFGIIYHAVMVGNTMVKPPTPTPFKKIPIYIGPAGGLPDDGSISQTSDWRSEVGQSIISSIKEIQDNLNRMMSFIQQVAKDISNPSFVEKVRGPALTHDALERRGSVTTIAPDEDIGALDTPVLPPELLALPAFLRDIIQRGSFSDSVFGVGNSDLSSLRISTTISSTKQILNPYEAAIKNVFGDIATDLLRDDLELGFLETPDSLPDEFSMRLSYDVDIPGDFINRANVAQILHPGFTLSAATVMETLFKSEISSPTEEFSKIISERNFDDPRFQTAIFQVDMERLITESRLRGDLKLARALQQQLDAQPVDEQQNLGRGSGAIR